VNAQCNKLAKVVGRMSTVASVVNVVVRLTTVSSLLQWAFNVTDTAYPFLFLVFFFRFLVFDFMRYAKLTSVSFWAHAKIAYPIVSYLTATTLCDCWRTVAKFSRGKAPKGSTFIFRHTQLSSTGIASLLAKNQLDPSIRFRRTLSHGLAADRHTDTGRRL